MESIPTETTVNDKIILQKMFKPLLKKTYQKEDCWPDKAEVADINELLKIIELLQIKKT